jgi:leader peptidase (prepilin peptidase)/N-methyltransferase
VTAALTAFAGALGLLVGSFLNVVVHRVPQGASVVRPRSACPACGAVIRPRDNVPVLSWLVLRGRCRDCGAPISARYPLVEVLAAALFVGVVLLFAPERPWAIPAFGYLASIGVALTLIDLEHHRLPDAIVLPSYAVMGGLLVLASWGGGDWPALARAGIGGLALWLFYFALMLVRQGGMGFGDVKLAGVLGAALAWLGWGSLAVGAFGAFLLGGGVALGMLVTRTAHRHTAIPFGPWMIAGAVLGVAVGEPVWSWYLGLLG